MQPRLTAREVTAAGDGEEWADWYALTPQQRWEESSKLWQTYLALGGSLDPEPDTQSPFFDGDAAGAVPLTRALDATATPAGSRP